jgi:hypothetical protein
MLTKLFVPRSVLELQTIYGAKRQLPESIRERYSAACQFEPGDVG